MSVKEKTAPATLVEHDLALKVYIDALLEEPAPQPQPVEKPFVVVKETQLADWQRRTAAGNDGAPAVAPAPDWRRQPFDSLLFKVAGSLTLAVPLVKLKGVLKWDGGITHVPGHADWLLGVRRGQDGQINVIDVAKFVIPENHTARAGLSKTRAFKHIVLIADGTWGLACDDLGDVKKIAPDDVRWRSDGSSRQWLAGTAIDLMCALLDVDRFVAMLKNGGKRDDNTQ